MPGTPTTKHEIATMDGATDPVQDIDDIHNAAVERIDTLMARHEQGLAANRPAAGISGRFHLATDTGAFDLDTGSTWARISTPTYVTALPGTPYDGQEIYYGADPSNGVIWHLRYRAAASGSHKWEFVGGSPMHRVFEGSENGHGQFGSSFQELAYTDDGGDSYEDPADVGMRPTIPLAGIWSITFGANNIVIPSGGSPGVWLNVKFGSASLDTADEAAAVGSELGGVTMPLQRHIQREVAASTQLQLHGRGSVSTFVNAPFITVRPIRVG